MLGRNQYGRVNPAANDLGAQTISNEWEAKFGEFRVPLKDGLDFNYDWLNQKLNAGYKVYDIGRGNYLNYSPNYTMELNLLYQTNYPTINTNFKGYFNNNLRFITWKNQ